MLALDSSPGPLGSLRRLRWTAALVIITFLALLAYLVDRSHNTAFTDLIHSNKASYNPNSSPPPPPPDDEEYVAICMAVRDQSHALPELLQHHYHHLGIRRFYIMDDGSKPPLSIKSYGVPDSVLTFQYFYPREHDGIMQKHIYDQCNARFGSKHTWIGYLDADEYLEMTGNETLVEFLKTFEDNEWIGAVGPNWKTHTSAGLLKRPPEGCRKAFTTCIVDDDTQDNRHIKSFVKTKYYGETHTPHDFFLKNDTVTVGEKGDVTDGPFRKPITRERWALHHYGVKSKEQYLEKEHRGNAMSQPKTMEWWNHIENMEHVPCPEMARYVP